MKFKELTFSPIGDTGVLINFGEGIDENINRKVLSVFEKLKKASLPFVKDIIPSYNSLAIFYILSFREKKDSASVNPIKALQELVKKIISENEEELPPFRKIKIPVCYADKYALDIKDISNAKNISVDEIIRLHTATKYKIYMIGFLPGFAYMGEVDERIAIPRKPQPRNVVEAGAVGIAGKQTGIYPLASPGGWQIIGKTPLQLFDKEKADPVLLQPGDEIEFYSITEDEFTYY